MIPGYIQKCLYVYFTLTQGYTKFGFYFFVQSIVNYCLGVSKIIEIKKSYLQASFQHQGTSGSDNKDTFSSVSCQYDNSYRPHTYKLFYSALFFWKILYKIRTWVGHNGIRRLCPRRLDTVLRSQIWNPSLRRSSSGACSADSGTRHSYPFLNKNKYPSPYYCPHTPPCPDYYY